MNLWERLEVVVDELAGLARGDVHTLCQSKRCDAINDTKVGLLGFLTLGVGNLIHRLLPYLRRCSTVNIKTFTEGFNHVLVSRQMGHDAQFYLTVVG